MELMIKFDSRLRVDFILECFSNKAFSDSFQITYIDNHVFRLSSNQVVDFYAAGMIGYRLKEIVNAKDAAT